MKTFKTFTEEIETHKPMTRAQALTHYDQKFKAKEDAWKAVRANRTDLELDKTLRAKAEQADAEHKQAYQLRTKYAPTI